MPEYTLLTVLAVVAVVIAELVYFRSGTFRTARYWWSIVIIFAFRFRWMAHPVRIVELDCGSGASTSAL
jgi:hypothetical protein